MEVLLGRVYKHYKGNNYLTICFATHSETGEKMVVYKSLYGNGEVFARPYDSFIQEIENKSQKYRFELQEIEDKVIR